MPKKMWEDRFRHEEFVAIWSRWFKAKDMWRRAWESVPFSEGGQDSRYNPVPSLIHRADQRAAAKEFQDARKAYHAEMATYSDDNFVSVTFVVQS